MNEEALYRLTLILFAILLTGGALYAIFERNLLRLNQLHVSERGKQVLIVGLLGSMFLALILVRFLGLSPVLGFSVLLLTVVAFTGGVALALHSQRFE